MRRVLLLSIFALSACSGPDPIEPGDGGPLVDAGPLLDAGDPCSDENLQVDPNNCGSCGNRCVFYGSDPVCVAGECGLGTCRAGYHDLNEDPSDGCEYQCTITDPLDPLDDEGRWSASADAELFVTLRSTSAGGDDGLTGLRTQVGLGYDVSDRLGMSFAYLRQQDFEPGGPDEIGHAPLIGIEYAF